MTLMGHGPAQGIEIHFFAGDGADDIRPGDKHVAQVTGHDDEIGQTGRIDRAAGAGAKHDGNLRHDAAGLSVVPKKIAVAGQAVDAFLNARADRVVEADHRMAALQGQVHDAGHF